MNIITSKYKLPPIFCSLIILPVYFLVFNIDVASSYDNSKISIVIVNQTLPEAIEIISQKTKKNIKLKGSFEDKKIKSIKLESANLDEIFKKVLRYYDEKNFLIHYINNANTIEIFLADSIINDDENKISQFRVSNTNNGTKEFTKKDFDVLLARNKVVQKEKNFSDVDFDRLKKRSSTTIEKKQFSDEDFENLKNRENIQKQNRSFTNEDFARLQNRPTAGKEYRMFNSDDFSKAIERRQVEK